MSLKAFHVVFVTLSTILAMGFGLWALRDARSGGGIGSWVASIASFVVGAALICYGRWFLRKLRNVSYL